MSTAHVHDLSLRDLRKIYDPGATPAVDGVSLDVAKGEFVSLLGPSGSGKTTTLMMIAGFEEPSEGDILIDGHSIVSVPIHRRDIGVVFQSYALFPKMTVAQNIAFPLRMRGMSRAERRQAVERSLDLIELGGYGERYPRQLSGGQQQRVALARALAFDPRLLLLDEPMGALDRRLREQMQIEVKTIQRKLGVTAIYVTHDQEEAMVLSDRIAIMNHGRIEQVGSPSEVYNRPVNRFVAQFLGTANLLPGVVEQCSSGQGIATVAGARVPFTARPGIGPGQKVEIFVRPECVVVDRPGTAPLEGTVENVIFVGEATRYAIRAGDVVVATTSHNMAQEAAFAPGDRLSLRWEPEVAIALPLS